MFKNPELWRIVGFASFPTLFKNPKLWRIVGFVSSIVGLICYALSSSFRHLYGKWNILKITIYVLVSLTISCIMLFSEKLQVWRYFRLKAHVVFLVLMLTSLYSVFYDKNVHGKPDLLSLTSNGAFALMSLSLSRQIELGFEVGISNFFLGCLAMQLMKINLVLTSAAGAFCYLVIVVLSHLDSEAQPTAGSVDPNDHLSIQIDKTAGIEVDTVNGVAGGEVNIEMDHVKGVAGEGDYNAPQVKIDTNDTFSEYIQRARARIRTLSTAGEGQSNPATDEASGDKRKEHHQNDHFAEFIQHAKKKISSNKMG